MTFPDRPPRLEAPLYFDPDNIFLVTSCVRYHEPVFADAAFSRIAVELLTSYAEKMLARIYAFCLMPDHVHLVLSPPASIGLKRFVGDWKNLSQRARWALGTRGVFWQYSFRDDKVYGDRTMEAFARYTLYNPVKAGLVERWQQYPHSGSLEFSQQELDELMRYYKPPEEDFPH